MFTPIDSDAACTLFNQRYAPGKPPGVAFAVAILPLGSELPELSEQWDGMFAFRSSRDTVVTVMVYRLAAVVVQLELF